MRPRSTEREEAHQPPAESVVNFRSGSYVAIYINSNKHSELNLLKGEVVE
ncbi:hypothetical protein GCM10007096_38840 [Pullulanibacillus pueri]|uniref:Uncharacterized protein n=1 Tax=Pullulanibacillus pueri TaxID=1437324 RepID=A0A8J2ZZN6_9BACL|nr:hypothetical protein GCM10007096_38840 [Pullulanibacillus pueri]